MDNKKLDKQYYLRFGVIMFLWLLLIGGLSYAYFSIIFSNDEKTTTNVLSGRLAIDFETGEYIHNEDMWPINDEDVIANGDKSTFSITRSLTNTTENVYYNIFLDEIEIDSDNRFKSEYIKWKLYNTQNPSNNTLPISEGTFSDIGNNTSVQLTTQKVSLPKNTTHNYTLYIWISNLDNKNQLELLNGSISCKIKIEAVTQ